MTYASIATSLQELLTRVPSLRTVERNDQRSLGQPGSIQPQPDDPDRPTPLLRLGRARRPAARESGWELSGTRQIHQLIDCELWAYTDNVVADADAFDALLDAAKRAIRGNPDLGGLADTQTSRVLQVKVVEHAASRAAFGTTGQQPLYHGSFRVDCWEEVWA